MNRMALAVVLAALSMPHASALTQAVKVDERIPSYKPTTGVSGSMKSMGSNTMTNLMTFWSEGFRKHYPAVTIENEGKGSGTAPTGLIAGTATLGAMSRPMKGKEIDEFEKQFGYKPTEIKTSIDMLAVFVHKDNPIQGLTLAQIDAVFSKTRKGGADKDIVTWGDLGLTGEWAAKPISLYGRDSASGTNAYFKEHALSNGDYKDTVKEQPGSAAVVQAVETDKYAIGYSGIGSVTSSVRALPIAKDAKSKFIDAKPEHAYAGDYPLARFLYLYINMKPGVPLEPLRKEFLRYVLSKDGQEQVVKDGYYPLTAKLVADALKTIGIEGAVIDAGAPR